MTITRHHLKWAGRGSGALLVAGVSTALLIGHHTHAAPAAGAAGTPSQEAQTRPAAAGAVVIDPDINETFTPSSTPPTGATVMSESAARAAAATKNTLAPATGATVQTGYFTFPTGSGSPNTYLAKGAYVYAYHWTQCGPNMGVPGAESPSPAPPRCTEWMFIDATTGDVLDNTWTK